MLLGLVSFHSTYRQRRFAMHIVQGMLILIHNVFCLFPKKLNMASRENGEQILLSVFNEKRT